MLFTFLILFVFDAFDLLEDEVLLEDADESVVDCVHEEDDIGEDVDDDQNG
jgi:hypothetical protein